MHKHTSHYYDDMIKALSWRCIWFLQRNPNYSLNCAYKVNNKLYKSQLLLKSFLEHFQLLQTPSSLSLIKILTDKLHLHVSKKILMTNLFLKSHPFAFSVRKLCKCFLKHTENACKLSYGRQTGWFAHSTQKAYKSEDRCYVQ